ncbi:MAG: S-layer homology domain-containing protein, partial [Clostridia bacterium]|nr:S-layer homology domain-containing protein [Clostridia bacterium]
APDTTTVRALGGYLCNYNGDELVPDAFTGKYSDIENHWAKETIEKFAWIGYGPDGDKFNPNEKITGEDFISLCETLRIYGDSAEIIKKESLLRMDAVKLIIDYLGYGKIASLKNVFITDFADNSDFKNEDIGYAAIARGFGLIEGDGENFRPYDTLTRAEALTIAENTIELGLID